MKEYLIDVGEFNIIVLPDTHQYFILGDGPEAAELVLSTAAALLS